MPYFHSNVMMSSFVAPLIQLWECLVQGQPCWIYGSFYMGVYMRVGGNRWISL